MTEASYTTERLLALRKLTRAIADFLRGQMKEYLGTLAPLLRPQVVLGGYTHGSIKDPVKGADQAFKELQSLYESVGSAKPFSLTQELKPPLDMISSALDMTVLEYSYTAQTDRHNKTVVISSPLKWALTYTGFSPARLGDLLARRTRDANELQSFLVHYLVMHIVVSKQVGIRNMFEALHFPITTSHSPDFGGLPITTISSSISTIRPPDEVIVESTEVSGMDAFEEIVDIGDIARMRDPLKHRLIEILESLGEKLPAE
jgi:hypothetical protein